MTTPEPGTPDPDRPPQAPPPRVPPTALVHQEGVIALVAIIGLSLRDDGFKGLMTSPIGLLPAVAAGAAAGIGCVGLMWLVRGLRPLAELEAWQREMVKGWSTGDAWGVAWLSGLAEEALVRALLQPLIGLVPAAVLFAALHVIPDRRLWLWPVLALALGLVLGALFEAAGYAAAAAAHIAINSFSLLRLQRGASG